MASPTTHASSVTSEPAVVAASASAAVRPTRTVRVCVWGCGHGELDTVYAALEEMRQRDPEQRPVDVLLCCGDFQAVRNESDLACMACPAKYRAMHSFFRYYSGERRAPVLTLFIGGNHEAANHMRGLPFGGWVAPNMYYLGSSGVVRVHGLRIAGISGIYKAYDFFTGYHERAPFNDDACHSACHVREFDAWRLLHIREPVDIFLSHDWPQGIDQFGDAASLMRRKPHFADEIRRGALGSPVLRQVLTHVQPRLWFAAHMHTQFAAVVPHAEPRHGITHSRFLALDKCLPGRAFLQVLDVPVFESVGDAEGPSAALAYDAEWLAVLQATLHRMPFTKRYPSLPAPVSMTPDALVAARDAWRRLYGAGSTYELQIPSNFQKTAAVYEPPFPGAEERPARAAPAPAVDEENPQTAAILAMLQGGAPPQAGEEHLPGVAVADPAEISIDDEAHLATSAPTASVHVDPAEIALE